MPLNIIYCYFLKAVLVTQQFVFLILRFLRRGISEMFRFPFVVLQMKLPFVEVVRNHSKSLENIFVEQAVLYVLEVKGITPLC